MIFTKFCTYSVDVAKKFGVLTAIFISCIGDQCGTDNVSLSRSQIFDITGIGEQQQIKIEDNLSKCEVIKVSKSTGKSDKFRYWLDTNKLESILIGKEFIPVAKQIIAVNTENDKKITKKEQTIKSLKAAVKVEDEVLKDRIFSWIEAILMAGKFLTKQAVQLNIADMYSYTQDKDIMLCILDTAIKNSWQNLSWVIDRMREKDKSINGNMSDYMSIASTSIDLTEEAF